MRLRQHLFSMFMLTWIFFLNSVLSFSHTRRQSTQMIFFSFKRNSLEKGQSIQDLKSKLFSKTNLCQPNGLNVNNNLRADITSVVECLEKQNPTLRPAYSSKMNGFWRLVYTDFSPPSTSSGKLGPFVGNVFQDLNSNTGQIINLLSIGFPPIKGGLVAKQIIKDSSTWEIEFDRVGNYIAGFKLPVQKFKPRDQIRLWEITYLDDELRILRARRPEAKREDAFIFILIRDEKSKFSIEL